MAANHADATALGVILCSPVFAGTAVAKAHAGWFTPGFAVLALAAGFVVAHAVRQFASVMLNTGISQTSRWIVWPLFAAHRIFPPAMSAAACLGIWFGTGWLVRQIW